MFLIPGQMAEPDGLTFKKKLIFSLFFCLIISFLFIFFLGQRRSLQLVYLIKQDILNYIFSRPNGWTEWAEIFCGHSWEARG